MQSVWRAWVLLCRCWNPAPTVARPESASGCAARCQPGRREGEAREDTRRRPRNVRMDSGRHREAGIRRSRHLDVSREPLSADPLGARHSARWICGGGRSDAGGNRDCGWNHRFPRWHDRVVRARPADWRRARAGVGGSLGMVVDPRRAISIERRAGSNSMGEPPCCSAASFPACAR